MGNFILNEMDVCRAYCTEILNQRQKNGLNSVKYPLISVRVNRYFLPEFRVIIADECNIIGYMDIQTIEYWDDLPKSEMYEYWDEEKQEIVINGIIKVDIDKTKTTRQQEMFEERSKNRQEAEERKLKANNQN
jgi:hypothetical protein